MPYAATEVQEVIPAKAAVTVNYYRIRRLSLDMGTADGAIPPVFIILIASGDMLNGVFTPVGRETIEIKDPLEIGALMSTVPLAGETLSQTTERAAFDYLIAKGHVPAGSIEV